MGNSLSVLPFHAVAAPFPAGDHPGLIDPLLMAPANNQRIVDQAADEHNPANNQQIDDDAALQNRANNNGNREVVQHNPADDQPIEIVIVQPDTEVYFTLSNVLLEELEILELQRRAILDRELELDSNTERAVTSDLVSTGLTLLFSGSLSSMLQNSALIVLYVPLPVVLVVIVISLFAAFACHQLGSLSLHIGDAIRYEHEYRRQSSNFAATLLAAIPDDQILRPDVQFRVDSLRFFETGLRYLIVRHRVYVAIIFIAALCLVVAEAYLPSVGAGP